MSQALATSSPWRESALPLPVRVSMVAKPPVAVAVPP